MAATGKIAEVLFEKTLETYEHQTQMLDLVTLFKPNDSDMQNSGNVVWRPTQQHAPIIDGFDLTGLETDIIEETYPAVLGTPKNDFVEQRVDDLRDMQFWERRGEQSGKKQATELNRAIAALISNTGSIYFDTAAVSGYDAIAEAQATLNERQKSSTEMRYTMLNDRDTLKYGKDLAGRQTLQGRPDDTWATGQIGANVAGFDVFSGSFNPTITGNIASTTTTAAVSEKPEGGSVNATTLVVTNVDYRVGTIPVVASGGFAIGDKVFFSNGGTDVKSIGLADKTVNDTPMTFSVVGIPNATSIEVYPKPIALNDPALSTVEAAYANVDTQILNGADVATVNAFAGTKKVNTFWCKNSIEVTGGDAPVELLSTFGGMRVISDTMSNGQTLYMAYDGNIDKLTFKFRIFTWYGLTNADPSANGIFVTS